ncbi:cytokine receptor-like factor 2 isoform X1 [Electrophorus electricus]|uniref:Fibronectin type-III domain-containing protein n=2 Tax=Electrophorus electricus TaxID=8005 RepID=A0A4W4HBD9_ELEEL|nr:cytokine receptor-like factor 2 isoform X1 [Electrophorus electricus]
MKTWRSWLRLALSAVLCFQAKAENSTVETFSMVIKNTSSIINVTWKKPDETVSDSCYRTHIQYRQYCDTSWKSVTDIPGFFFQLPAPDLTKNYVFRLRMRLYCINSEWSEWSPEKYWNNDTDLCIAKTSVNIKNYLLVTLLLMAGFLLFFAITQERVRRLVLPIIPDPKHTQETILNVEELQWCSSFPGACEECKTAEILVVEETEIPEIPESTHTAFDNYDRDLTANSINPYSPVPLEQTVALICPHTTPGYIVL